MQRLNVFGLLAILTFTFVLFLSNTSTGDRMTPVDALPQNIQAIKHNQIYSFAGEPFPMNNFDAMERLDRELLVNSYWHSSTILNIKYANRYFPLIERILAEQGVPDDLKYLAVAESGLRNATSSAGAKGVWQFMKASGKEWGLEINDEVDERYHVEKATVAACKYLKYLYKRFGSWANAAGAYNVGPTRFASLLKSQNQTSYFDLNLNDETSRYYFRLNAIKQILQNPEKFGFYIDHQDKYAPLDNYMKIVVDKSVTSWANWAQNYGVSYRMLKVYNPWLTSNKLTVIKNTYHIKVPRS